MVVSAIVLLLIFLPICATLLLSMDRVQNYLIQHATKFASEYLDSRVEIGRIDIDLLSKVHIYDFYVEDPERDTLLYVNEAVARITSLDIKRDGLCLNGVEVTGAEFNLREMESGTLYVVGASLGIKTGSVFLCVWNQERFAAGLDDDSNETHDTEKAIKTAVEAIRLIIKKETL